MNRSKLTKDGLLGFSISFNKAKALGITDDDLIYVSEIGPDKFRVSIRDKTKSLDGKDRHTKVVYGLIEAIKYKWELLKLIERSKNDKIKKKEPEEINPYLDFTVRQGIEKFFADRSEQVEKGLLELSTHENNIQNYQSRYIRDWELLDTKIIEITNDDAQDYVNYLHGLAPVKKITKNNKLSINTINTPYQFMHLVFEYFREKLKVIKANPFTDVENRPKYKPQNQNYLTTKEIDFVLKELDRTNIRFKLLINLFLETGLRIEEIIALKFSNVNRLRLTLKLEIAVIKSSLTNQIITKDLKTDESEREISISSYVIDLIDNIRTFKEACGFMVRNDDFIFTAWEDLELISPELYTADFRKFITGLGFKDLPMRNLRHTSATFMLQGETNLKAVKKRFGWSKDSTVFNIYNQSNLEEDRKLLEKFEAEFRNRLGASFAELYCIAVNRLNNKRLLNNIMQKILDKPIEKIDFEKDLKKCQDYLFELYPVFSKIAEIDSKLDDEEVEAVFVGFKPIYKSVKVEPLET